MKHGMNFMPKFTVEKLLYKDEDGETALLNNVTVWLDAWDYDKAKRGKDIYWLDYALYPETIAIAKQIIIQKKENNNESTRKNLEN